MGSHGVTWGHIVSRAVDVNGLNGHHTVTLEGWLRDVASMQCMQKDDQWFIEYAILRWSCCGTGSARWVWSSALIGPSTGQSRDARLQWRDCSAENYKDLPHDAPSVSEAFGFILHNTWQYFTKGRGAALLHVICICIFDHSAFHLKALKKALFYHGTLAGMKGWGVYHIPHIISLKGQFLHHGFAWYLHYPSISKWLLEIWILRRAACVHFGLDLALQ